MRLRHAARRTAGVHGAGRRDRVPPACGVEPRGPRVRPRHLPPRHVRRRAALDGRAPDARGRCETRPEDRALGRLEGRSRGPAGQDRGGAQGWAGGFDEPGGDPRSPARQRRRRRQGHGQRGRHTHELGVTCALCHSTVDDSLVPGIGKRLDGWANTSLDVGAILALSPALDAAAKAEFKKWGPGKYDPRHHYFDGAKIVPLNATSVPIDIPAITA